MKEIKDNCAKGDLLNGPPTSDHGPRGTKLYKLQTAKITDNYEEANLFFIAEHDKSACILVIIGVYSNNNAE